MAILITFLGKTFLPSFSFCVYTRFSSVVSTPVTVAQHIVRLWTPDGEIDCPQGALAKLLAGGYRNQGCSEVISCCRTQGCLIVPNPQCNQNQQYKVGFFDNRAFKGHRFFSTFEQIAKALYVPFRKVLTVEIMPTQSLFEQLARNPQWLCSQNRGVLPNEEQV